MRDKRMDGRPTAAHELLLIRVGHHLWRSRKRKEWPEPAISRALEAVWEAKEHIPGAAPKRMARIRGEPQKENFGS